MDNPSFALEVDMEKKGHKEREKYDLPVAAHSFEEAVSLVPVGKFHYLLMFVGGICFMAVMVEVMTVSIILPFLKCDLPSNITEQGLLASSGFLGIVLSSHIMGFLADTKGRVKVLRISLVLSAIASFISAFSVNIWMLIVFRFLTGFFISGGQACVFSLTGEFHGNKSRTKYVTLLSVFLPVALMFLPALAIALLPLDIHVPLGAIVLTPWRILIICNISLSLLALIGLFLLPETPKYQLVQGDHDGALETLRYVYVMNTGRPVTDYPVQQIILQTGGSNFANVHGIADALKLIWDQTVPLFYRERCLQTVNICTILFVVYGIAQGSFMWFPLLLNEMVANEGRVYTVCDILGTMNSDANMSSDVCGGAVDTFSFQVIIMVGSIFTVIYMTFAYTIDFVGKKNLIIIWLCVTSLCVISLHWANNFFLIVGLFTITMSVGNCGGLVGTIAAEYFPTHINAMGMCFVMMVGRLGAVVGSNVIGPLLFSYCDNVLWGYLCLMASMIILCATLPERKFNKSKAAVLHEVRS